MTDDINLHVAKSVSNYVEIVNSIAQQEQAEIWFRGHSKASYRLEPTVLRGTIPLESATGHPLKGNEALWASGNSVTGLNAERMLAEFRRRSLPFLPSSPKNDFEWMFVMQHHGVPTRLLDWSTNALVGLYFAAEHAPQKDGNDNEYCKNFLEGNHFDNNGFVVWVVNPGKLNTLTQDISTAVDVVANFKKWKPYVNPMWPSSLDTFLPIAVVAPHVSPRIRAQSGTFTLHGANIWPIDYYTSLRPIIHKIFFPYSRADAIKSELTRLGMTTSFIYPDLEGISREIVNDERVRFQRERSAYLAANFSELKKG